MPNAEAAPSNTLAALTEALNVLLANSFALYVKTKNFHWHVSGPHFRDYHLLLDEQAAQIFARTDEIAERVRKLGFPTLRSVADIARRSRIADNEADRLAPEAMLRELRDDNAAIAADLRMLKMLAEAAGDIATSALVDTWVDEAEQRVWFLQASLAPAAS